MARARIYHGGGFPRGGSTGFGGGPPNPHGLVNLVWAANVPVDLTLGDIFVLTTDSALPCTMLDPTGGYNGQQFIFILYNDGAGMGIVNWDISYLFPADYPGAPIHPKLQLNPYDFTVVHFVVQGAGFVFRGQFPAFEFLAACEQYPDATNLYPISVNSIGGQNFNIVRSDAHRTEDKPLAWFERRHDAIFATNSTLPALIYGQVIIDGSGTGAVSGVVLLCHDNCSGDGHSSSALFAKTVKNGAGSGGNARGIGCYAVKDDYTDGATIGLDAIISKTKNWGPDATDSPGDRSCCAIRAYVSGCDLAEVFAGLLIAGSGTKRYRNGICIDSSAFDNHSDTIGLNMAAAYPSIGIKVGQANSHLLSVYDFLGRFDTGVCTFYRSNGAMLFVVKGQAGNGTIQVNAEGAGNQTVSLQYVIDTVQQAIAGCHESEPGKYKIRTGNNVLTGSSEFVFDNYKFGIGTATPGQDIHIYNLSSTPAIWIEGNTKGALYNAITVNREIFAIRASQNIASGAGIDLFGNGDSTYPGQTTFFNGGSGLVHILVNGVLKTESGRQKHVTRITNADSPYTALDTDEIIFADSDGGAITVNLPAGITGAHYRITNVGSSANNVTVDGNGAEQVRGAATQAITDGNNLDLYYESTEGWW